MIFKKVNSLKGELTVPGDKSVSHRAIMLGSIAEGTTEVVNFLQGADCLSTIQCFSDMGIEIKNKKDLVTIKGNGLNGLKKPNNILDVGNSGTTLRLMSGLLCGQLFSTSITGDASIQKRPMKRIMTPLSFMGASITCEQGNDCAPVTIKGNNLKGIHYQSPVASAQIKSAVLLAGLYAEGPTSVTEPNLSRNHTELMFQSFGIEIESNPATATACVKPPEKVIARKVIVPGDISSAAYFIAAGLIVPKSEILIKNVGINPTRDGILQVCKAMGADITLLNIQSDDGEPTADLLVRSSELTGTVIEGAVIPTLIDELPVICALACFAKGQTIIKDASELKVKESNRIDVMVTNLSKMGADVTATEDGMIINGTGALKGAVIDSNDDHRIAMTFAIAGLMAEGETEILHFDCVAISYPDFYTDLQRLIQ